MYVPGITQEIAESIGKSHHGQPKSICLVFVTKQVLHPLLDPPQRKRSKKARVHLVGVLKQPLQRVRLLGP